MKRVSWKQRQPQRKKKSRGKDSEEKPIAKSGDGFEYLLDGTLEGGDLSGGGEAGREADWVDSENTNSLKASPTQIKTWQQADPS